MFAIACTDCVAYVMLKPTFRALLQELFDEQPFL